MIELTDSEKSLIKLCKGHYQDKYPFTGKWTDSLKPLFKDIYGWNPDEDNNYHDYLDCAFYKLLDIHLKIQDDKSGSHLQLRNIFKAALYKGFIRDEDLPVERAISELCGLIQSNSVLTENDEERYQLD
jgi:hypothetical protein